MPTAALHQDLAEERWEVDRAAQPVAPLTEGHSDLAIEDAYWIQKIDIDRRITYKMAPAQPGDVLRAEVAHLGAVTFRFSKEGLS